MSLLLISPEKRLLLIVNTSLASLFIIRDLNPFCSRHSVSTSASARSLDYTGCAALDHIYFLREVVSDVFYESPLNLSRKEIAAHCEY